MSSLDKLLSVLDIFDDEKTFITSDDIQASLGISRATSYRYLQALSTAGLLNSGAGGKYRLGARIIQLDRAQRLGDDLLAAARQPMEDTANKYTANLILSTFHGDRVFCSYVAWKDSSLPMSYERGRPMPLFYGAMAKVILARLSSYQQRRLMLTYPDEIRKAGLGENWEGFRRTLSDLRKQSSSVTLNELSPLSVGVGAVVLDGDNKVAGSVAFAVPNKSFKEVGEAVWRQRIETLAKEISDNLTAENMN